MTKYKVGDIIFDKHLQRHYLVLEVKQSNSVCKNNTIVYNLYFLLELETNQSFWDLASMTDADDTTLVA